MTEILADADKFERKMKWREVFADEEPNENWVPEIFKKEKVGAPTKFSKHLGNFLTGVRSELTGTVFNKARSNISKEEAEAVKTLVLKF